MRRVVLLGLLVLGMVSCKKEDKVLMKYAYKVTLALTASLTPPI